MHIGTQADSKMNRSYEPVLFSESTTCRCVAAVKMPEHCGAFSCSNRRTIANRVKGLLFTSKFQHLPHYWLYFVNRILPDK